MRDRRVEASPETSPDLRTAAPRASALRAALREAAGVLPSRDPAKNGKDKLLLYLGLAVPAAWLPMVLLFRALEDQACLALMRHGGIVPPSLASYESLALVDRVGGIVPACVLAFAYLTVAPLVLPWLATFLLALGFHSLSGKTTRSRLQEALVCPYCRDEVDRDGTFVCARPKCGALYHKECWKECVEQYGGCAVYGCASRRANEVTATGLLFRFARLVFAALLFPPKLARAIKQTEGEGFSSIYRSALAATRRVTVSTDARENKPYKALIYLGAALPLSYAICAGIALCMLPRPLSYYVEHGHLSFSRAIRAALYEHAGMIPISASVLVFMLPWLVALPLTLAFFAAKAFALAFESELAALGRADEGGTTVIGRLRLGLGKK